MNIRSIVFVCAGLFFSQSWARSYCEETVNPYAVAKAAIPFATFMAYHLSGTRANMRTHVGTFLMITSTAAIIATEYPSKTFAFLASFAAPIAAFGLGLNVNKLMDRPIAQTTAVKLGRIAVGVTDFVAVPAFWYWYNSTCRERLAYY